jgi:hypothetical protein
MTTTLAITKTLNLFCTGTKQTQAAFPAYGQKISPQLDLSCNEGPKDKTAKAKKPRKQPTTSTQTRNCYHQQQTNTQTGAKSKAIRSSKVKTTTNRKFQKHLLIYSRIDSIGSTKLATG